MNAQHTPGPWSLNEKAGHPWVVECQSNVPGVPGKVCEVGYRPNARLIAAAPDLLEALENLLTHVERYLNFGEVAGKEKVIQDAVHAAIAKAKGE